MLSLMSLDLEDARTRGLHERLSPYVRELFSRAAHHARVMHADEISREHLLMVLLEDEESAASQAVLFGFADPETLVAETLALSPGILVVGSGASLPFSPLGVRGLFRARELAAESGASAVGTALLFAGSRPVLPDELRSLIPGETGDQPASDGTSEPIPTDGPLFAHFDAPARRALGTACRTAGRLGRSAISPAHIVEACLETEPELALRVGVAASRVRSLFAGRDADESEPPEGVLVADDPLATLLEALPAGAGSMGLLAAFYELGSEEVVQMLSRHKVTPDLVARAGDSFRDPEIPARRGASPDLLEGGA